jgi:predicted oxidoreductase
MRLSPIVAGCMRLLDWGRDAPGSLRFIHGALEAGVSSFDHADVYGGYACEAAFGRALALEPGLRERLQIVTKCGIALVDPARPRHRVKHYDTRRAHVVASLEHSLAVLGTDHVELLLIHRPDPLMDADELAAALDELRRAGKALEFGVSNFPPHAFDTLQSRLAFPLRAHQLELSLLRPGPLFDGSLDQCQRLRVTPMAWSPLGAGRLASAAGPLGSALDAVAAEAGATREQVALAWIMAHPARPVPVVGTGRTERLAAAMAATRLALDRQQWFRLLEAARGCEVD